MTHGKGSESKLELHEKLQMLRKNRGMTQEELAQALYVSRTAVSKWESGRGYPSIESLKQISTFFGVSVDELLSSEQVLSLAENENRKKLQSLCHVLTGMADLSAVLLIVLPLYPYPEDGVVYAVNLLHAEEISAWSRGIHGALFLLLIVVGAAQILTEKLKNEKGRQLTACSMGLSVLTVLFLAMTREAYAIVVAFLLFVIKMALIWMSRA